ncbi:hypothetical protein QTP86_002752 [Hemibagrus guttatus]|nr:hypothetical protein QTP86_002752 [Hemibagrus guttatus]
MLICTVVSEPYLCLSVHIGLGSLVSAQSEYIAQRDARLAWMSGFTGSSGTGVVTQDKAVLWTDSRYWVQAERQMDCNWELGRDVSISSITKWLIKELNEEDQVGYDPFLFSVERTWQMKVDHIRAQMMNNPYKPTAVLLSALDETAWLFNMRGNDIPFNPFFYSYTLLTLDKIWQVEFFSIDIPMQTFIFHQLFVHTERLTEAIKVYLNSSCILSHCVQLYEYETVREHLKVYLRERNVRVWVGTEYTNQALYELITPEEKLLQSEYSPVLTTKAIKDETEQKILREAHIRDAVAVMQLLYHLERTVPEGQETELTAAQLVNVYRSMQKFSKGPSFETISASGPNAALAHYSPSNETARKLTTDEMYLIDSGGQYLDGTTDITRTVHWGSPTKFQKEAFTRVLMGNIEISRTIFPAGTRGKPMSFFCAMTCFSPTRCVNMEMLGRRALWEVGLNYGHGTGHGVGNYFGVHEWPVGFQSNNIPFQQGMFTSIEPGYYKVNEFGIRIEDVAVIVPAKTMYGNQYLTFNTVSLVPYDRKLIDTSILSPEQLQWLDTYYLTIQNIMGPELKRQGLTEVYNWMMQNTEPFLKTESSAAVPSISLLLLLLSIALL